MLLLSTNQYNQGISKHKLLASNAGVGSIITSKLGYYILVSDITKWDFVNDAMKILAEIRKEENDPSIRYEKAKFRLSNRGINMIDDKRFIEFVKQEKDLPSLICLIAIPSMSLDEYFNTPNWRNHPINRRLGGTTRAEQYMVKGTHFPKWFRSEGNELKHYSEWKKLWHAYQQKADHFVPPRDAKSPIVDQSGKQVLKELKDENGVKTHIGLFKELIQTNVALICPNGHLSDVPWPKFLKWKSLPKNAKSDSANLFDLDDCCSKPDLMWTESKTKSDGYASIYIECRSCGTGSGNENTPKINLEGITNLRPCCPGHKPWEIDLRQDAGFNIPSEPCYRLGQKSSGPEHMQLALVTGNNIYFATAFSSLYLPQHLAENRPKELIDAINKCNEKFNRHSKVKVGLTKEEFWAKLDKEDFIIENSYDIENAEEFLELLKKEFFATKTVEQDIDTYEAFRWQEYQCFCSNAVVKEDGLKTNDIKIPAELQEYFYKIQQVSELRLTQVQLDFTRVKPKERVKIKDKIHISTTGKNIFSCPKEDVFALPAVETVGEGLFFKFNERKILEWEAYLRKVTKRYDVFMKDVSLNSPDGLVRHRIMDQGIKHFLIHTFAHILMRELEFSCGYPTASLKERLYISQRMSGVLIYTAEGSEGSMGGLVWQGQPDRIHELLKMGLERSHDCSSDPLCWESEGQGIFDLNLAACFSCAMVSETSCEERNFGLDRRALLDPTFGYFKAFGKNYD